MKTLSICVRCNNTYSSFVKEKWTKEGIIFKVYRCESCGRWKHFKGYMDVILVYQPGFFFILNEDSEKLTLKRKNNKMTSYCLGCRRRTSGSFVRQGSTRTGRGYSILKCVECGRSKSVFNKKKRQTGGILWSSSNEFIPNNGYAGLAPFHSAYTNPSKGRQLQRGNGFDIQQRRELNFIHPVINFSVLELIWKND